MAREKCGCEIRWVEMASGKIMPCNPNTVAVIVVDASKKGKLLYGYTPHWETCPKAKLFKHGVGDSDEDEDG